MFEKVSAKYENGTEKYVVVDEQYSIYEPILIFIDVLYEGYKLNTRNSYIDRVVIFLNFLCEKGMTYDEVTPSFISKYINYLQGYEIEGVLPLEKKLLGSSINTNLTAIKSDFN